MSCDAQDAFLTVKQRDPTMIVAKDAVGNEQPYALGRVLSPASWKPIVE